MPMNPSGALALIARNIERHGYHVYAIAGGESPRYLYTIGLRETLGYELVFAGGAWFELEQAHAVVAGIYEVLRRGARSDATYTVPPWGTFTMRRAHGSWTRSLLLGAAHYYGVEEVDAYQIVPDEFHRTIDVPDLSRAFDAHDQPVWRWLEEPWPFPFPAETLVGTNLAALRGAPVTSGVRWEVDYWEMYAGAQPESNEDARLVPMGTLLATDETLQAFIGIDVGQGLRRDAGGTAHPWVRELIRTVG